jgi:hypothetical protein
MKIIIVPALLATLLTTGCTSLTEEEASERYFTRKREIQENYKPNIAIPGIPSANYSEKPDFILPTSRNDQKKSQEDFTPAREP